VKKPDKPGAAAARMRSKFDSPRGREILQPAHRNGRAGLCESPEQGDEALHATRPKKVDAQWQLFTMVHNIEKIARWRRAN
jgi:hypothetical protein